MFSKTQLDSGLSVVTENHSNSKSVAVGVFIETGTRDEALDQVGISHFLEHMVFKGTKKRSPYDISRSIEAVGGDLNAYTTREYTCYHSVSLKENLRLNLDVLGDLVSNAQFPQRDFEKEKNVILQEISMTEENPEELAYDLFFERVYDGSSLGWPILGTQRSLGRMKQSSILRYYRDVYGSSRMVVAVAGHVDHDEVVGYVEKYFKRRKLSLKKKKREKPRFKVVRDVITGRAEQVHFLAGFNGLALGDRRRYEAYVLNAALGGGMSSKLYQSIREKKGLAYSVYSAITHFVDSGTLTVYVGTDEEHLEELLRVFKKDLKNLQRKKLSEMELNLFRKQVLGNLLLGSEDMENRMNSLGVNELVFQKYISVEEVVERLEDVGAQKVRELAVDLLDWDRMSVLLFGQMNGPRAKELIR